MKKSLAVLAASLVFALTQSEYEKFGQVAKAGRISVD
jgi:hypothetical protein